MVERTHLAREGVRAAAVAAVEVVEGEGKEVEEEGETIVELVERMCLCLSVMSKKTKRPKLSVGLSLSIFEDFSHVSSPDS